MDLLGVFKSGREESSSREEAILYDINLPPGGALRATNEGGELLDDFRGTLPSFKEDLDKIEFIEEWGGEG